MARRISQLPVAVAVCLTMLSGSIAASAQEPTTPPAPTTTAPPAPEPTDAPATTAAPADESTTTSAVAEPTTAPPGPEPTDPDAPDPDAPDPDAPDHGGSTTVLDDATDDSTETDGDEDADDTSLTGGAAANPEGDPLTEEGPLETVPDVDVTVPAADEGAVVQPRIDYRPDAVLISSVEDARVKLAEAEQRHLDAIAHVKSLRLRGKELDVELEALDFETRQTIEQVLEAEERLRARATSAFTRGDGAGFSLDHDDLLDYRAQQTIVETVFEIDNEAIDEYLDLRGDLDIDALGQVDRRTVIEDLLDDAILAVEDEALAVEQAARELIVFEAGSQIYIENVVFPIDGDYGRPLIDSWGFPRMTGTADSHAHQGIDIFAPMGTPLVAAERGVLTRVGIGRLGGLKLWLRGESGTDWYYAHLSDFAPGIAEGQVVEAGELVGYVGDTGNAKGTPPHLHMQVHPNGGDPINPYPMLSVISERQIVARG